MKTYPVTLTGKTPLIMHQDSVEWADFMDQWKADPANKKMSRAGDDRTPAWRWIGTVYHDGDAVGIPASALMPCFMGGGALVPVPGGKNGKTFKAQSQSGMMCVETLWPIVVSGKSVSWKDIEALKELDRFSDHVASVRSMGFDLIVKRAAVGAAKHIRVRPIFREWSVTGSIVVWDEQIDANALRLILRGAGRYKGLGDWRPGSPKKPGPYGTFEATIR